MSECSCYKAVMASAKVFLHSRNPPAQHNIACSNFFAWPFIKRVTSQDCCIYINLFEKLSKFFNKSSALVDIDFCKQE